ncbi:MAG: flippase-like domain-containing protein [Chloroflexi bacterium]|nr:flippase-like domain-containing protein [Chloroflexota bacterium]
MARGASTRRSFWLYLRPLAQLAIAAALLGLLLWRVDLAQVRHDLAGATIWWLPLAFGLNLLSDWFRAIRWQQLLAPLKQFDLPFLFGTAVLGVSCNFALPFRAGELIRVQVMRRRSGLKASNIVATILSEKLLDMMAFAGFIVLGVVLYEEARFLWPLAVAYAAITVSGLLIARRLADRWRADDVSQPDGRLRSWLNAESRSFGEGLQSFKSMRALFRCSWTSYAAWLCEAGMYYACGRALGLELSPAVYLLVVVVATIAVSMPFTPAGLGVFEVAITTLLVAFGVSETQAATFAIFSHVMLALPYFVSGPITAMALKVSLADIFFLRAGREPDAPEPAYATARSDG